MTSFIVFEKTGPRGDRGVVPISVALIVLGCTVALRRAWLPPVFALH